MNRLTVVLLSMFLIQACGGGGGGSTPPPTPPPVNIAPTVNAGDDQTVDEQTEVTLTGAATDSDGSIASYAWVQTAGTSVSITNGNTPTASFDAPDIMANETLTFQLTATDNDGATSSDTVNIAVVSTNAVPIADAGMDQSVNEQVDNVALSGANSTDSDGSIVDFEWSQISGTPVTLGLGINSASVTFTSPTLTVAEVLTFSLLVTDDGGATASDTVEITVFPVNQAPIANAGTDQAVAALASVTLDGSSSSDSDGSIDSYEWSQISGTALTITDATKAIATFTAPDVASDETFNFQLLVTDNEGEGRTDLVTINVISNNTPPTADAGKAQFRTSGMEINLDASNSTDNETSTNNLTFFWHQTDTTGIIITLEDNNVAFPYFTAPSLTAARTFTFEVIVTDPGSKFDSSSVSIAIQPIITTKSNDTGIVTCGDYAWFDTGGSGVHRNVEDCAQTTDDDGDPILAEQDGHFGPDVTANDDTDGHAGFSFTKLDVNGNPLEQSATSWSCVLDNTSKLVWEVKIMGENLQDSTSTYTWYNTDTNANGGNSGTQNGGVCSGSDCDTQGYMTAVNAMNAGKGLCGISNWKIPTREQLGSIVNYEPVGIAVDPNYFPNSANGYWSSEPYAKNDVYAWIINFVNGKSLVNGKNNSNANGVRLVYDGQCLNGC